MIRAQYLARVEQSIRNLVEIRLRDTESVYSTAASTLYEHYLHLLRRSAETVVPTASYYHRMISTTYFQQYRVIISLAVLVLLLGTLVAEFSGRLSPTSADQIVSAILAAARFAIVVYLLAFKAFEDLEGLVFGILMGV